MLFGLVRERKGSGLEVRASGFGRPPLLDPFFWRCPPLFLSQPLEFRLLPSTSNPTPPHPSSPSALFMTLSKNIPPASPLAHSNHTRPLSPLSRTSHTLLHALSPLIASE